MGNKLGVENKLFISLGNTKLVLIYCEYGFILCVQTDDLDRKLMIS